MSEQPLDLTKLITTKEAAELTGYSRTAILSATSRGNLDSIKLGNMRFYSREDVLKYKEMMQDLGTKRFTPRKHLSEKPEAA